MESGLSPAINVCVTHDPNGASMTRRSSRGAHPLNRVRLVFTEVSSIKTTRSGCADTAGIRCLNQSSRCRLTLVWRRSPATSDFFVRVAELAKEFADRIRICSHAGCIMQGGRQFRHRDVAILLDNFGEETAVRIGFSLALGTTLRSRADLPDTSDCKSQTYPRGRRKLQAQRRRTSA